MANKEGDYSDIVQRLVDHTEPKERAKTETAKENKTTGTSRGRPKGTSEIKRKEKKQRHVYLDDDLYNKIKSIANNKGFNFTQYVELILQKSIRRHK